jgi:hypothetical protein
LDYNHGACRTKTNVSTDTAIKPRNTTQAPTLSRTLHALCAVIMVRENMM